MSTDACPDVFFGHPIRRVTVEVIRIDKPRIAPDNVVNIELEDGTLLDLRRDTGTSRPLISVS